MADTDTLIAQYEQGAPLLREAVAGMTPDQLRARPVPGKWSTLELVAHLADFELVNADRIKRVIAEDQPSLLNADETAFEARLHYMDRDLEQELTLIEAIQRHVVGILRRLPADDWTRTGRHSTDGSITLRTLLERTAHHVRHHLPFVAEKRAALGHLA